MKKKTLFGFAPSNMLQKHVIYLTLILLWCFSFSGSVIWGQEAEPQEGWWATYSQRDRFLGDFDGQRTQWEDAGVRFSLYHNFYYGLNAKGGIETSDAYRLSSTLDMFGHFDLDKLGLMDDTEMLFLAKTLSSRNINNKVGALSDPFDDADGNEDIYIDMLWFQKNYNDKELQLRIGYLDQQTALDRNVYTASEDKQFMTTYLDNNNAIIPLAIGLGVSLFINPNDYLSFVLGAADAEYSLHETGFKTTFNSDRDFIGYFQTDIKTKRESRKGDLPGTYRFGLVFDPRNRGKFGSDQRENSDVGFYTSFDQMLTREQKESPQGLGWFMRYGYRHSEINRISNFWSTGFQYTGMLPGRDKDLTGLGMYSALGSAKYERYVDPDFKGETGYELYHSFFINPWMTLAPDLQYKHNPGGKTTARDALILGLRMRIIY